ncbi:MAG: dihydroxy-acid dehydratase [Syntrophorhabdus sp.]
MEKAESIQEMYNQYKGQHTIMDRRIQMLLKKSFLTEAEEREIKDLKKKKLYYKDLMESLADSL